MIQVSPALNTSYTQQRGNPEWTSWEQAKINLGMVVTLWTGGPRRAGGPRSLLKHTQSMEKAQASRKGPSHVLEVPGSGIRDQASSEIQCIGSMPVPPPKTQAHISLSSRQLQLHQTGWLRQHRGELGNITNDGISKCYFSVANWRMSVPNLDQTWIFLKSFEMLQRSKDNPSIMPLLWHSLSGSSKPNFFTFNIIPLVAKMVHLAFLWGRKHRN